MPNAFMYYRINDQTETPVPFAEIDNEMRVFFNAPADPKNYYYSWYDTIGDLTSQGLSFADIEKRIEQILHKCTHELDIKFLEKTIIITKWMSLNFKSKSWYEPKVR